MFQTVQRSQTLTIMNPCPIYFLPLQLLEARSLKRKFEEGPSLFNDSANK